MKNIFKLEPVFKDYIWGGNKLKNEYNKSTPYEKTAESWELSCHKNGKSRIVGGEYDGCTLDEMIEREGSFGRDVLGSRAARFSEFPILIKLIDANDALSVQVHPSDEYAMKNEGSSGKTELWYVVAAEEGAELIYGFSRDVTKDEVMRAVQNNELLPLLNSVKVKAGDAFFVRAGLVHAIGKGILICEIQQSSDITYRLYDWGRVGKDGKGRELHIDKSLDVMKLSGEGEGDFSPSGKTVGDGVSEYLLSECEYFKVRRIVQSSRSRLSRFGESFAALNFLSGRGSLISEDGALPFEKGDSVFVSATPKEYEIVGECEYLITEI